MLVSDKIPLNFGLLANPWNWIIILLMVYIVGLSFAAIFHHNILPGDGS